jgi:hypothetical protein
LKSRAGFWGDKYAPETLEEIDFSHSAMLKMWRLVHDPNFPHALFVGQPGSGKRIRVLCLLRQIYGCESVNRSKIVTININGTSEAAAESLRDAGKLLEGKAKADNSKKSDANKKSGDGEGGGNAKKGVNILISRVHTEIDAANVPGTKDRLLLDTILNEETGDKQVGWRGGYQ